MCLHCWVRTQPNSARLGPSKYAFSYITNISSHLEVLVPGVAVASAAYGTQSKLDKCAARLFLPFTRLVDWKLGNLEETKTFSRILTISSTSSLSEQTRASVASVWKNQPQPQQPGIPSSRWSAKHGCATGLLCRVKRLILLLPLPWWQTSKRQKWGKKQGLSSMRGHLQCRQDMEMRFYQPVATRMFTVWDQNSILPEDDSSPLSPSLPPSEVHWRRPPTFGSGDDGMACRQS